MITVMEASSNGLVSYTYLNFYVQQWITSCELNVHYDSQGTFRIIQEHFLIWMACFKLFGNELPSASIREAETIYLGMLDAMWSPIPWQSQKSHIFAAAVGNQLPKGVCIHAYPLQT